MEIIKDSIKEIFCNQFNDKINEKETLDEFINSFPKNKLENLLKLSSVFGDDASKLASVISASTHKKDAIVEEFKKSIKDTYTNVLSNVTEDILIQLEVYLKKYKNNLMIININKMKYSLHFIEFIHNNYLAKVKYLKSESNLYIYTPKELLVILRDILKNKDIKKSVKNNSIVNRNVHNLLSTYGIISLKELNRIYNITYGQMEEEALVDFIIKNHISDDEISLCLTDEGYIAYNLSFENDDDALEFYYSLPEELDYKIYTKEEYEEIGEGIYHNNFDEMDSLYDFLEVVFNMSEEEMYSFDEDYVLDYLYSYQLDKDIAKSNLSNKLEKLFGKLTFDVKVHLSKTILSIARNYPNFNFKGHSYNEINK